jgi:hypothetical protein
VAHACNPSYSKGRGQEDGGLKPAQADGSEDPNLKILHTKQGRWSSPNGECLPSKHEALGSNPKAVLLSLLCLASSTQ